MIVKFTICSVLSWLLEASFVWLGSSRSPKELEYGRAPDFFIMGAQKAGTTAARENLRLHPDIFLHPWEVHWFDNERHGSVQQYKREKFGIKSIRPNQIVGDDTPIYMYFPNAVYDIHKHFPMAKLIFCLRDPVERLYSQFMMNKYDQTRDHRHFTVQRNDTFEAVVQRDLARMGSRFPGKGDYVRRGIYVEQLERAAGLFPRSQMHLICSEQVRLSLDYNATFRFLGVQPRYLPGARLSYVGSDAEQMHNATIDMLSRYYEPWNRLLVKWLKAGPQEHRDFIQCVQNWT